jgi:hypothetical protein
MCSDIISFAVYAVQLITYYCHMKLDCVLHFGGFFFDIVTAYILGNMYYK